MDFSVVLLWLWIPPLVCQQWAVESWVQGFVGRQSHHTREHQGQS